MTKIPARVDESPASELSLRLRLAWGGPRRTRWTGRIGLSSGEVTRFQSLSLEANSPGSKQLERGALLVFGTAPSLFDGVEVTIRAPRSASLTIELEDGRGAESGYRVEIPLEDLLQTQFSEAIDEEQSRISVRRAWSDSLQFQFKRQSLVFSTGELFQFDLVTNEIGLEPNSDYDVLVRLLTEPHDEELWSEEYEARTDAGGNLNPLREISLGMPSFEGVYNVVCEIRPRRITSPILRPRAQHSGMLQLVVIDPLQRHLEVTVWDFVHSFDPANPKFWDRILSWPHLPLVDFWRSGPLMNRATRTVEVAGRSLTEIPPGGWVAYPIPLGDPGWLHKLELEFAAGSQQQLGISLVEPNEGGRVLPLQPDSAIVVTANEAQEAGEDAVRWHRMMVWPKTSSPLVLLHNLSQQRPARFGVLNVSRADYRLPVITRNELDQETGIPSVGNRQSAIVLDRPLLAESFSAPEYYDPIAERTLDDWRTFFIAAQRLTHSMSLKGQRTAFVAAFHDGSTIYPSQLLEPTPKYDMGVFFSTGQDPIRKDVLEMMFRIFDREGLTLVPQLEFSAPLPKIENWERRTEWAGAVPDGIRMVQDSHVLQRGSVESTWIRYNPLSPEVQRGMLDVVDELVQRYSHHASFGGVSIRIGPHTYTHFPGERWGYDFPTVHRYLKTTGQVEGIVDPAVINRAYQEVVTTRSPDFLRWRSEQLSRFYGEMANRLQSNNPNARLYLSMAELFRDRRALRALAPEIRGGTPNLEWNLLSMGLDPFQLNQYPGVVALQPRRRAPLTPIATRRVEVHLDSTGALADRFRHPLGGGAFTHNALQPVTLEGFDELSPFGSANTDLILFPQTAVTKPQQTHEFLRGLAREDLRLFADGAMLASPNLDEALSRLLKTYILLPDTNFEEIPFRMAGDRLEGVVARFCRIQDRCYLYFVNPTPWSIGIELTLNSTESLSSESPPIESLGDHEFSIQELEGLSRKLGTTLQPYDLAAAVIELPDLTVTDATARFEQPEAIAAGLDRHLETFTNEVDAAESNPLEWPVLINPSFEVGAPDSELASGGISGWDYPLSAGTRIESVGEEAYAGERALLLESDGSRIAWIRSNALPVPQTGRISISVWLKVEGDSQPPLRLSVEANHHGNEYYRFAEVGALSPTGSNRQVSGEWRRFGVHFDDLPPEGIQGLRIGFDLMGKGKVYIDDVRVYDLWIDERDYINLVKMRAVMKNAIFEGDYLQCQQMLETYWPQALLNRPSLRRSPVVTADATLSNQEDRGSFPQNVLDSVRGFTPRKVFPFR